MGWVWDDASSRHEPVVRKDHTQQAFRASESPFVAPVRDTFPRFPSLRKSAQDQAVERQATETPTLLTIRTGAFSIVWREREGDLTAVGVVYWVE
jgi:hypothetical protein